ncbi:MAG: electron transport complex subunit RsxC [Bacteroidales bacterium]|nr:electron transport complex subunit RsxC [Bacteroidales bacterium]MCK9499439.1 electron transport complex subunit RsxC [Bacteroidales bacterium]MDY0313931.1 electron transport complex subunit RsxC [Bacteroidales bacterium]NLB86407.1 electron transport complex subunit RsxC [Bacteroidales bacterium]
MLKTFPLGGVHPKENKFSAGKKIENIDLPKIVNIPISQHIGSPAQAIVAKGDSVKVGQLIAKSTGFVSANIHSSVSGKVLKIDKVLDLSGYKQTCIIIEVENDEWIESIDRTKDLVNNLDISIEDIKNKIIENGIVGLGGATFPTHVKLSIPPGKSCKHLIINAVECEPYLTSDHQLILEKADEILVGCKLIQKVVGAENVLIGIENNKPDAIKLLSEKAKNYSDIEVHALKVMYPQGGEKQLIKALIKREVPSGGLPIDVGCVVQNVGTAFAIYEAVQKNKPLIERVVTVTGISVSNPKNILTRIGTPSDMLIAAAGGLPENTGKIVSGGPMMGKALANDSVPITKGSSGILILPEEKSSRPEHFNCIRCGRCITVCPMGLEPYLLKNMAVVSMFEDLQKEKILDCIECGSCAYTCPAGEPLLDYIRLGKANLNKILRAKKS